MNMTNLYDVFNQESFKSFLRPAASAYFAAWCLKIFLIFAAAFSFVCFSGCAPKNAGYLRVPSLQKTFPPETILSSSEKGPVSFDEMITDLSQARVVYVGESHFNARHHEIQLRILKALYLLHPDLSVGMEMFSRPYQQVLDEWKEGRIEKQAFVRRVHWYANWKYDYGLYEQLLEFIRSNRISLYALNIAFHIPPKIAAGGIKSLLPEDALYLPRKVNLSDPDHREYVKKIFKQHGFARRNYEFENFYQAQCVWEDIMAESISLHLKGGPMIVFAGNGHIANKYGIPDRAYSRTKASFKTVMPVSAGREHDLQEADYIWVTPPSSSDSPH
ncbi:MAG: ChaN family lipoprotein [Desulfosalsimonas sp.]